MLERIAVKVTSSKFWAFVSTFVVGTCVLFHVDVDTYTQIGALILIFGDLVVYTFANVEQKKNELDAGNNVMLDDALNQRLTADDITD